MFFELIPKTLFESRGLWRFRHGYLPPAGEGNGGAMILVGLAPNSAAMTLDAFLQAATPRPLPWYFRVPCSLLNISNI
jgi:hypothetical protein